LLAGASLAWFIEMSHRNFVLDPGDSVAGAMLAATIRVTSSISPSTTMASTAWSHYTDDHEHGSEKNLLMRDSLCVTKYP
jgi:hypothetical protein